MDKNIGDRLKAIRGNEPQKAFAERLGVNKNSVGRLERNEQPPTTLDMYNILEQFPEVNPAWLLTGEGPMYKDAEPSPQESTPVQEPKKVPKIISHKEYTDTSIPGWDKPDPEMFDYVPMTEATLSAGGGAFVLSEGVEGYYAFRKQWLRTIAPSPKRLILMRVAGDSMTPTIQTGDTVLIDTGRQQIKEGFIYALRVEQTIMIKRLSLRPGGIVLVISDNRTEFEPYETNISDIHVLGQVIWVGRVFPPE